MTDQQPEICQFDEYKWEEDEEWQVLVTKLEFPANYNDTQREKFLFKRKQKYFKKNVDPDFEIRRASAKAAASNNARSSTNDNASSSTPSSNDNSNANANANASETAPQEHVHSENCSHSQPSANASGTSSNTSSNSSSNPYQRPYGRYKPPPTKLGAMIAPLLTYFYLMAQVFIFCNGIASIAYPPAYTYCLLAVAITHFIATLQNCGRPRFAAWYGQLIMNEENTMIAVYGFILLMGARHLLFLSPILLRSLFMSCYLSNGFMQSKLPQSLYSRVKPLFYKVISKQVWFNRTIAMSEVIVGIFLIFACFFMSRTVVMTLIYWQIMQARYMMSGYIRLAFTTIHGRISGVLSRIPMLLNLYLKLSGFLSNMVDPDSMRQRMQGGEGGGAGGGIAGMASKYCTIM